MIRLICQPNGGVKSNERSVGDRDTLGPLPSIPRRPSRRKGDGMVRLPVWVFGLMLIRKRMHPPNGARQVMRQFRSYR